MTFDEMIRSFGGNPSGYPPPPMPNPMPDEGTMFPTYPLAGGGAESSNLRQLWDRTPPMHPIDTRILPPNFADQFPMMAQADTLTPLTPEDLDERYNIRQMKGEARRGLRLNEIPALASPYSIYPEELDMHYRAMQELNEQRRRQLMNEMV
jgi:hypothetical protein